MKIVIDIPEHCIEELNNIELNELNEGVVFHTICCVRNGIPIESLKAEIVGDKVNLLHKESTHETDN